MSDTPRTDAASRMAFSGEYMVPIQDAQKLERELADMAKQRDALAEALRTASERFRNPKYGCMWDDAADDIDKTLSAVKGGIHE